MKTDVDTRDQARQTAAPRPAPRPQAPRQHPPGRRPAGLPPGPPRPPRPPRDTPPSGTRPARPAAPAAPPRRAPGPPAPGPRPAGQTRPVGSRMPFMLLVLGLLGGGLVCLLIINTTLSTAQVKISDLQQQNQQLAQEQQTLQQQIATDQAPGTIEKRAFKLGMREQKRLFFLDVGNGRVYRQPNHMRGEPNVIPVRGFTP